LDLGGRPPLRFLRLACSWLKYSEPRLAISCPPFRPSLTAAGSFFFGKIQRSGSNLLTVLCMTNKRAPKGGQAMFSERDCPTFIFLLCLVTNQRFRQTAPWSHIVTCSKLREFYSAGSYMHEQEVDSMVSQRALPLSKVAIAPPGSLLSHEGPN
jgi:hypothetical protein